jgi:hypothetical protein
MCIDLTLTDAETALYIYKRFTVPDTSVLVPRFNTAKSWKGERNERAKVYSYEALRP